MPTLLHALLGIDFCAVAHYHTLQDNRLQIGDHILQINGVNMRGMGSDQVGQILRQSGPSIKLIVARPVDPTSDLQVIENNLTIVPTRSLNDPTELEKQIQCLQQVSFSTTLKCVIWLIISKPLQTFQSIPTDTSPIAEFLPDLNANFAQLNVRLLALLMLRAGFYRLFYVPDTAFTKF